MNKKTELQSFHALNHSKCMMAAFQNFRQDETLLDVTLACNGFSLKAHKIVLSACSPYFKDLFADNPCKHPIVILKDVEFADLKAVIDFMYRGELSVPRERLVSTLKVAEELQVRGLKSSESTRRDYEKLYKQVCEKQRQRKRRKKHLQISSDSDINTASISIDSDQESVQTDDSFRGSLADSSVHVSSHLSNPEFERSKEEECISGQSKESRPVVLHVGDPSVISNDHDKVSDLDIVHTEKLCIEEKQSVADLEKDCGDKMTAVESNTFESSLPEENTSGTPFDSFVTCPENSKSSDIMNVTTIDDNMSDGQDIKQVADANLAKKNEIPSCSKDNSLPLPHSVPSELGATHHNDQTVPSIQVKARGSQIGFECRVCGRVFTSRAVLIRHEIIIHKFTDTSLPFKCHYCPFASKKASHLKNHMLTHTKKSPYKCSVCARGFKTERHLQQHLCVHTDEKRHSCDTCPSKFKRYSSLITHRRVHRQVMPFMCRFCCKKFFRGCDLLKHEKTCHGKLKHARFKVLDVENLSEI